MRSISCAGTPSVMQTIVPMPASIASYIASAANGAGTKTIAVFAPASAHRGGDRVEDRDALDVLAALSGRHAGDDVRPVRAVAEPVEAALRARQPLDDETCLRVDEDRHQAASSTARRAPSSIVASACRFGRAASPRMRRPSSAFVPSSRTTIGCSIPICSTRLQDPARDLVAARDARRRC